MPRWDGISRFLLEAVPKLKSDFDITILAPDFGDIKEFKRAFSGVRIIRFSLSKRRVTDYYFSKPKISVINREVKKADIVWVQDIGPIGTMAMMSARFFNVRRIAYVHSLEYELVVDSLGLKGLPKTLTSLFIKFFILLVYNSALVLLVPSFEVANLLEKVGVERDKIIVHMGINTHKFRPFSSKAKRKIRKKLHIPKDSFVIGYCSRIAREKDPLTLLRAFSMLKLKNTVLLVVGSGVKELEDKFKRKKNVKFVGSVNNAVPYLNVMNIYVLPTLTETSSLSTMEAMSCGVPVLVTPVGCLKNYVKSNFNGFFFKQKDYVGLAVKLREIIKHDKLKRLSLNARKTILRYYDFNRTVKEIRKVLNSL